MSAVTSAAISGVSGAPAARTSCASGSICSAARRRCATPFWRVIRPTNTTDGRPGSTPWRSSTSVRAVGLVLLGVDAVVDDLHALGVERRVARQHVAAHPLRDGDDRVGGLERGLLAPARQRVAAAELLGLPRPQRLEAVDGRDVRHVVHELREMAAEVRVPGVAVDDVGALGARGHREVDRHRAQRREVRRLAAERVPGAVGVDLGRAARRAAGRRPRRGRGRRSASASSRARYSTCTPAPP